MAKKLFLVVLSLIFGLSLLFSSCILQNNNIANVASNGAEKGITVSMNTIWINLKPTQSAIAGEVYDVDLYDKGTFRATTTVSFTQPDINVGAFEPVAFPATNDEVNAYFGKDLSNIFSVKVHEPVQESSETNEPSLINPNIKASLTLTYPNGSEIWHVGKTVNITWTSTNLTKDSHIVIYISNDSGNNILPLTQMGGTPNTGSYKWKVTEFYVNVLGNGSTDETISYIGNHTRIKIFGDDPSTENSMSVADFTILPN